VKRNATRNDARSRREALEAFGLFLTAVGAAFAILIALFGEAGTGVRGFLTALALGAFVATGFIMATDRDGEDGERDSLAFYVRRWWARLRGRKDPP
jgi:hypothetical protein